MHIQHVTLIKILEASNIIHWLLSHLVENILHRGNSNSIIVSRFNLTLRLLNCAKGHSKLPQPPSWCVCQQKCSYCNHHQLKVTLAHRLSHYPQPIQLSALHFRYQSPLQSTAPWHQMLRSICWLCDTDLLTNSVYFTELPLDTRKQFPLSFCNIFAMPLLHLHMGIVQVNLVNLSSVWDCDNI